MSKNIAIGGAIVIGVAAVAGIGWKTLKNRKAAKAANIPAKHDIEVVTNEEMQKPAKTIVEKRVEEPRAKLSLVKDGKAEVSETAHHDLTPENLRASEDKAPSALADMPVEEPVQDVQADQVTVVEGVDGPVASVSRMRVAGSDCTEEVQHVPAFWNHFYRNIRREELVLLAPQDFVSSNKPNLARGYHKAHIKGFDAPAVVHVTKGHVSAVVHVGGTVFLGFSTSGSRFPKAVTGEASIPGTFTLDAVAAKDFLNGR